MDDSRKRGIERLLEQVRPLWDHDRQERVFAGILTRIRHESRGTRRSAAGSRSRLRLSHAHA